MRALEIVRSFGACCPARYLHCVWGDAIIINYYNIIIIFILQSVENNTAMIHIC